MDAFWIILTASLIAVSCALLGCYLILRNMAMVADAISHAVLPGIVIAFLLSGSRHSVVMFIGACAMGLGTTFLIEIFHRKLRLQADAAIGITFTSLFAVGVILVSLFSGQIDLDQDCVLYGEIVYVPLDVVSWFGVEAVPRAVWISGAVLFVIALCIVLAYKELFLTTFDAAFAAAIGISVQLWHYVLMGLVSLAAVSSFESVGAILVVALLVVPPATAFLLTDSFPLMLLFSSVCGIIAAIGGYILAFVLNSSIAGAVVVIAGAEFLLAILFAPRSGLVVRLLSRGETAPRPAASLL